MKKLKPLVSDKKVKKKKKNKKNKKEIEYVVYRPEFEPLIAVAIKDKKGWKWVSH